MNRIGNYREVRNMVCLEITSWQGVSLGAIHYYGEMKWDDENGKYQTVKLTRKLTKKSAIKLNKQHRDGRSPVVDNFWQSGFEYDGFDTKDDVKQAAIKKYNELGLAIGMAVGRIVAVEKREIIVEPIYFIPARK